MCTPQTPQAETVLRDQIERYRAWLAEELAIADAFNQDHPNISVRALGQTDAMADALEMLNAVVPQEDPLARREPAQG